MKYIKPTIEVNEAQAAQMLAESLGVYPDQPVDGGSALTKEDKNWEIWDE